jgi:general secretion pathway protein D
MIVGNNLRVLTACVVFLMLCPQVELLANRKGDKYLKMARLAEAKKEWEVALDYYQKAMDLDPTDPAYEVGVRRMRFQAGQAHVNKGQQFRDAGQLDAAVAEFQRGFAIDPSSGIAIQEMRRTMEMIERNKRVNLPEADRKLTPVELERKEQEARVASLMSVPRLKPINSQISTLKMNNQPPKVLYETVGKLAGVNVVFDPGYQNGKNANLDISNSTLEEALDDIAMETKTFWKPISANTIFVAEDNVTKRRDYEDQVVKVFYLKNITSVQEFQEIVTAVRSITDIRRMFTYNAQNAVMCRGTVDQIALAEKLFTDLDKPKSEVVLDVVVMYANRDRTRNLAAGLVSGGNAGLSIPIGFSPSSTLQASNPLGTASTSTTGTATTSGTTVGSTTGTTGTGTSSTTSATIGINQIGKVSLNDFQISLPSALFQAIVTDNKTKVLQSPQVRASDGQKVSLRIGDKVPYATGSFQPGVGTVGVSPLVSTQFNFAEVGVNVDMTPHVHGSDEVTMHILIEISDVSSNVTIGGLTQPVISQRKTEAEIRLRDGEVSLLGGLLEDQLTDSVSGLPGIVDIPVLGHLFFGGQNKEVVRQELIIALIPHIVRTQNISPVDLRGVMAGTDATVKVMYAPTPAPADGGAPRSGAPGAAGSSSAPSSGVPAAGVPNLGIPGGVAPAAATSDSSTPANASPGGLTTPGGTATPGGATTPAGSTTTPGSTTPTTPTPGVGVPVVPPGTGAPVALVFGQQQLQAAMGSPTSVTLDVHQAKDLASAPFHLKWDPKLLRLNKVTPGALIGDGSPQVNSPTIDIRNDSGEATISLSRVEGSGGVSGSGPLVTLSFTALGKGTGTITVDDTTFRNSKQEAMKMTGPSLPVTIQ